MTESKTNKRHVPHLPPEAFSEMECKFLNEHDTFVPDPQTMVAIVTAYQALSDLATSETNATEADIREWMEYFNPYYSDDYPTCNLESLTIPPPKPMRLGRMVSVCANKIRASDRSKNSTQRL